MDDNSNAFLPAIKIVESILNSDDLETNQKKKSYLLQILQSFRRNKIHFAITSRICLQCSICLQDNKHLIPFACLHHYCLNDFYQILSEKIKDFSKISMIQFEEILQTIECPKCGEGNYGDFKEKFMKENIFKFYEDKKLEQTIIQDPVTWDEISLKQCIQISCCQNSVPLNTFIEDIKEALNNNQTQFPCMFCKAEYGVMFLYQHLPKDLFSLVIERKNKYYIFSKILRDVNTIEATYLPDDEIVINCITPTCDNRFIKLAKELSIKDPIVYCHKCKNIFCPRCGTTPHNKLSCEEYKNYLDSISDEAVKKRRELEEERRIQELQEMKKNNMVICPHCGVVVEKTGGCNFITCKSLVCGSKKFFCFLCNAKFDNDGNEFHFVHYFNKPFGDQCVNSNKNK